MGTYGKARRVSDGNRSFGDQSDIEELSWCQRWTERDKMCMCFRMVIAYSTESEFGGIRVIDTILTSECKAFCFRYFNYYKLDIFNEFKAFCTIL